MAYRTSDIRSVLPDSEPRQTQAKFSSEQNNVVDLHAPQHRTPEQILAECQSRYDQMVQDAARPEHQFPCSTCAHGGGTRCRQPLIVGIERRSVSVWDGSKPAGARLCGPEKALWQPRKPVWQRVVDWFFSCLG